MPYINTPNELKHYGVPDMHWGERKYQYKDGSLTPEGRVHYGYNTERAKANVETAKKEYRTASDHYNNKTGYGLIYDKEATKKLDKASRNLRYAEEDLSDEKTKEKLNKETKVSKRRESLEAKYREKGMTEEEAAIAAYKRERTEKILAVAGGVAVTALVAYGAYKYRDYAFDKVIPSGTTIQNISQFANKGVDEAFYASWKSSDNNMYRGFYGEETKKAYGKAYETRFKANNDMKIASPKNAQKIMADLLATDNTFKSNVEKIISEREKIVNREAMYNPAYKNMAKVYTNGSKALKSGKNNNAVYRALNSALTERSPEGMDIKKKFYDALSKKGYGAIDDLNDKKRLFGTQGGYGSKSPIIVFDGKKSLSKQVTRELSDIIIHNNSKKAMKSLYVESMAKKGSIAVTSMLASYGINKFTVNKRNDSIVKKYREEHPNTELSYKEIVRQYEDQLADKY